MFPILNQLTISYPLLSRSLLPKKTASSGQCSGPDGTVILPGSTTGPQHATLERFQQQCQQRRHPGSTVRLGLHASSVTIADHGRKSRKCKQTKIMQAEMWLVLFFVLSTHNFSENGYGNFAKLSKLFIETSGKVKQRMIVFFPKKKRDTI